MRKILTSIIALILSTATVWAIPAYRGWQTKVQPDGTTIEVRQIGDEFYSYWETREGKIAQEQPDGKFLVTAQARPTVNEFMARRAKARTAHKNSGSNIRRAPKAIGLTPNLAPRGVVLLVNFTDSKMKSAHTNAVFDDMCNSTNCTTNAYDGKNYPSAAQFFADQSNNAYRPVFDVFGPVNLPHNVKYYGEAGEKNGQHENDLYLADFVIDAVLAAEEAGCDFSKYDSDNDGYVDFVYIIYAGKNEAYGGSSNTIWPHNWSLISTLYLDYTHGTSDYYINSNTDYNLLEVDGKYIDNYACSSELDGYDDLGGIGVLCHEFSHVMGLPDFYDTEYGENHKNGVTPDDWDLMDGGGYNGNTHCPPNYGPWEKYFFGWINPVNPGNEGANGMLYPNGSVNYNVFQINQSGNKVSATKNGLSYYLEYRDKNGWDEYTPGHGMVVWRVDFDGDAWSNNAPNNEAGNPRFTAKQVASGSSWSEVSGKPVTDIVESNGSVTFKYMGGGAIIAPCAAPTDITAEPTDTSALVRWDGDASSYELRYREYTGSEPLFSGLTSFETGLEGWTTIDADGDGYTWIWEKGYIYSESYSNDLKKALTPDNYLVSPKIRLGGSISFWAIGYDSNWCQEHFGVAVSTKGNTDAADFTMVSQEMIADSVWTQYTVDLSKYSGTGYVALRHFNVTDMYIIAATDIEIIAPEEADDDWTVIKGISEKSYTISDLKDSTIYELQTRSLCDGTYSAWTTSLIFTTNGTSTDPEPDPVWTGWAYYDNGTYGTSIGVAGDPFFWGVMFPAKTLGGDTLSKVAIQEYKERNIQPITIDIHSGGSNPAAANKIYSGVVAPSGEDGLHEITLDTPVPFDKKKNLWVILSEGTDEYPAHSCVTTGDPNGRWVSFDGVKWYDIVDLNPDLAYTFMIRAYVGPVEQSSTEGYEWVDATGTDKGHKVLQNGQLLIVRDGKVFNILGSQIR